MDYIVVMEIFETEQYLVSVVCYDMLVEVVVFVVLLETTLRYVL